MYVNYNPNPLGKRVGDCVVRAISKALDSSWEEIYIELSIQGYIMGDVFSSNSVWGAFLKNKGFERDIIHSPRSESYTIDDFCYEHPKGTFVIGTGTHAVSVIDGDVYDAWDSRLEIVLYFWEYKGEKL